MIIDLYVTTGYSGVLHVLKSIGNTTIRAIMQRDSYHFPSRCHAPLNKSLVLPLNKSTDVPLASSASNGKKIGDSSQICDYRFLPIIITNQSTNIEYYQVPPTQVLLINRLGLGFATS